MFGYGTFAARSTLAGLAGLALLAVTPSLASAAPAAPIRPAHAAPAANGSFKTWSAAQRAAGFRLRIPRRTYGLKRRHPILVGKCEVTGKTRKRAVFAEWDGSRGRVLSADQNNSGGACGNIGSAVPLGIYHIRGHRARMFGYCDTHGRPSCKIQNITLALAWHSGQDYYVTFSTNEWRSTLAGFARSLYLRRR